MVRSPRASMKIADTGVCAPGTRTQPMQSTPSRAKPSTRRSPITSLPAGPPSGAAKRTLPPSRAIAIAALAAQPPPMVMNSLAAALASGVGNSRTRNTSSRTATPAQRMFAMSDKAPVGFKPRPDDVMGDRDRMGRGQAVGVPTQHHGCNLLALEPAGILQLGTINLEFRGQSLRMASDHQRHREGPRLRCEVRNASAFDTGLLQSFPSYRIFDGFARLDETRKARPHALGKAGLPAKEAALTMDRQHDDDRIGTRKMLGAARRAITAPAGLHGSGRRTTIRAKAVASVPRKHGFRLRQRREVLGRHQGAGRDATQVRDDEIATAFQRLSGVRINRDSEQRCAVITAEEHLLLPRRNGCGCP